MQPFAIKPIPGSPLEPALVIGRDKQILAMRERLVEGNNVLLTDPRRMGKTSLMQRFCNEPGSGITAVMVDYEGIQNIDEFLLRTVVALRQHTSLWSRVGKRVGQFFDGLEGEAKVGGVTVKGGFSKRPAHELLTDVVTRVDDALGDDEILVLALDEITLGLSNIVERQAHAQAESLLQQLQYVRKRPRSRIRWILAGSVGFHHVLRAAETTEGLVGDLMNLPVGPLSVEDAGDLFRCLMLGIDREAGDAAVDTAVAVTDAIPVFLHHLAHRLRESGKVGPVSEAEIASAFAEFINSRDDGKAFTHLVTRIDGYYGHLAQDARAMLDYVASAETLVTSADLRLKLGEVVQSAEDRQRIMDDLRDDHYLIRSETGEWSWRYEVLRLVWLARREQW